MTRDKLPVLAVDLDGTLLRSNMLYETFWSAFSKRWSAPFRASAALLGGRAHLKHFLNEEASVDPTLLPYDQAVIDYILDWRNRGGRVALVTATNQSLAEAIATHLGIFDEVIGSDRETNLKGEAKARKLVERYGAGQFVYIGDHPADLAVWRDAAKVIVCNPDRSLAAAVRRRFPDAETIARDGPTPARYLKAIRVHQWAKNPLVFLPMLGAHVFDVATVTATVMAFFAFCLIASSVYVLNDLLDLSADRRHPRKRLRPFASGTIPIEHATWMWLILFVGGIALGAAVGTRFLAVLIVYLIATTAYSLYLKRKVIIDICTLAGLYTIRVAAGAVAAQVPLSMWMLAFSLFLFFSLASIKRQAELVSSAEAGVKWTAGRGYSTEDLHTISSMAVSSGYVSVLVLALYINSPVVGRLYSAPPALWGSCLVLLYWISRMSMVATRGNMHDDPIVFAATDRVSQLCALLMVGIVALSTSRFGVNLL